MIALTWRCDGSAGIRWHLRGIAADGSFYGEISVQSTDEGQGRGTAVTGRLQSRECRRMAELVDVLRQPPSRAIAGPHFAAIFERMSAIDAGDARLLYEYEKGSEIWSERSRAFVELAEIVERHLTPCYVTIA